MNDIPKGSRLAVSTNLLAEGRVAVVTLAGGVGSRWTKGAGAASN